MKKENMAAKEFNSVQYGLFSGLTSLFANLMSASFIGYFYMRMVITNHEQNIVDSFGRYELIAFPFFFLVPTVISVIYLLPFYAPGYKEKQSKWEVRMLNAPLMISLIGCIGWILSLNATIVLYIVFTSQHDGLLLIKQISGTLLSMIFTFMLVYYLIDLLNRYIFIEQLFKNRDLSSVKGVIHFSIGNRFLIYFVSAVVFPIFSLFNFGLKFITLPDGFKDLTYLLIITTLSLVIIALITWLFMGTYKRPILALAQATGKIHRGDYNVKVNVRSTDELGQLSESVNATAVSLNEKELIKDTFGKMVDPQVRDYLLKGNIKLGGERRESTILFSDIRNFTSFSESTTPERTVDFLNIYFEEMNECIEKNNGLINKYIGDAVLGIFGNPVPLENHGACAVTAAINMRERLKFLNQELKSKGMQPVEFGVGIHSGDVIAGNIGSRSRMEYTVIGDNVNIAARLETLTKSYGIPLLISRETWKHLDQNIKDVTREIDFVRVKGKSRPVRIYEVFEADSPQHKLSKSKTLDTFNDGVARYRNRDFIEAKKIFQYCADYMPFDMVSRIYIKRCDTMITNPPSEKWRGIAVIQQ